MQQQEIDHLMSVEITAEERKAILAVLRSGLTEEALIRLGLTDLMGRLEGEWGGVYDGPWQFNGLPRRHVSIGPTASARTTRRYTHTHASCNTLRDSLKGLSLRTLWESNRRSATMAAIIVEASQRNGMHFLSQLGLFKRENPNGGSLSSPDDVALWVAEAYHAWLKETGKENSSGDLEVFYKDVCKLRLAKDGNETVGGYMVLNGTLMSVFSARKGMGAWLVRQAMNDGAMNLDCFDGFLVDFYKSLGWSVDRREANWTPGGPDVVFMRRVVAA